MRNFKKCWWKILLITIICGAIDLTFHKLAAPSTSSVFEPSYFAKHDLIAPAITVWEFAAFAVLSLIYILIENKLPYKKLTKGFLYGLFFGSIYLLGMFEPFTINDTMLGTFLMGFSDFIPILICGILLAAFTGSNGAAEKKTENPLSIFVIALFYVIGRYFSYSVLHIESAYINKPLGTFIWTLCFGLLLGIMFFILKLTLHKKSPIYQAAYFGIVIFGTNWLLNHSFMLAVAAFSFDGIIRVASDSLYVTIGVYAYKKLFRVSYK